SFADSHMHLEEGGWGRQTTARELPSAPEIAGVNMRLTPGGVRELHWHKSAEWAYMLKGLARITAVDQDAHSFQNDVSSADRWYLPPGSPGCRRRPGTQYVQPSDVGPRAHPNEWRNRPHYRFLIVQSFDDDRGGLGRDRVGRNARTALAPQCRRVAVLHLRAGADDHF